MTDKPPLTFKAFCGVNRGESCDADVPTYYVNMSRVIYFSPQSEDLTFGAASQNRTVRYVRLWFEAVSSNPHRDPFLDVDTTVDKLVFGE